MHIQLQMPYKLTSKVQILLIVTIMCQIFMGSASPELYKIYSRYKQSAASSPQFKFDPKNLPEKISAKQQIEEFYRAFEQNQQLRAIDYHGDPQLNSHFVLHRTNSIKQPSRRQQTIFVMGRQFSKLFIEINVKSQFDKQTQLNTNKQEQGVYIFIFNTQDEEIMTAKHVISSRIFIIDAETQLYAIKVIMEKQLNKNSQNSDQDLRLNIDLRISVQSPQTNKTLEDLIQFSKQIYKLYHQSSTIFLDSLEDWQVIEKSQENYLQYEKNCLFFAGFELTIFILFALLQLGFLKRLIKNAQSVI